MNFYGLIIGLGAFVIIGVLHPAVIVAEYRWGKGCWPLFAAAGLGSCIASLFAGHVIASVLLGVLGFSLFWSIHELFAQEKRVEKGWYPANPAKKRKAREK